jgi:hypothetical protein
MLPREIIADIGIEVEFYSPDRNLVEYLARERKLNVRVVADGSVRRREQPRISGLDMNVDSNINVEALKRAGVFRTVPECGVELITPVINTNDKSWEKQVLKMLELGLFLGEGIAPQTGIHVHVNSKGIPLQALHNLLKIWRAIEAGIYRISCGPFGEHRGVQHKDAHYCRPLLNDGPLVWRDDSGYARQCYTVDCRTDTHCGSHNHYHTPRYSGLTFHPLWRQGSIELRTFNSTLNIKHVLAWVHIAQSLIQQSFVKLWRDLPEHPYGTQDLELDVFFEMLDIREDKIAYAIEDLWEMGVFPPFLKGFRWTHLDNQRHGFSWGRIPHILIPDPLNEEEIDIHDSETFEAGERSAIHRELPIKQLNELLRIYPLFLRYLERR